MLHFLCLASLLVALATHADAHPVLASKTRPAGKTNYDVVVYHTLTDLTGSEKLISYQAELDGEGHGAVLDILDAKLGEMAAPSLYVNLGLKDLLWFDYDEDNQELHAVVGVKLDNNPQYIRNTYMDEGHIQILDLLKAFGEQSSTCPMAISVRGQNFQSCTEDNQATIVADIVTQTGSPLSSVADTTSAKVSAIADLSAKHQGDKTVNHFVKYGDANKLSASATVCVAVERSAENIYQQEFDLIKQMKAKYADPCSVNFAYVHGPAQLEVEHTEEDAVQTFTTAVSVKSPATETEQESLRQAQIEGSLKPFLKAYICGKLSACGGTRKKALAGCEVKTYDTDIKHGSIEAKMEILMNTSLLYDEMEEFSDVSEYAVAHYLLSRGKDMQMTLFRKANKNALRVYSGSDDDKDRNLLFRISLCSSQPIAVCDSIKEEFEDADCNFFKRNEEYLDCDTEQYDVDVPVKYYPWVENLIFPWQVLLALQTRLETAMKVPINAAFRTDQPKASC